jgi:hypothetical protein
MMVDHTDAFSEGLLEAAHCRGVGYCCAFYSTGSPFFEHNCSVEGVVDLQDSDFVTRRYMVGAHHSRRSRFDQFPSLCWVWVGHFASPWYMFDRMLQATMDPKALPVIRFLERPPCLQETTLHRP